MDGRNDLFLKNINKKLKNLKQVNVLINKPAQPTPLHNQQLYYERRAIKG